MTDEALIDELERLREPAKQYFAYYSAWEERELAEERPATPPNLLGMIGPLKAILMAHPIFGAGQLRFFATKYIALEPHYISQGLLRMMLDTDASSAVAWLHRVFGVKHADLRMVAAIHGLSVEKPVKLDNGVRLMPLSEAPDSPRSRMHARQYYSVSSLMMDMKSVIAPVMAVVEMGSFLAEPDNPTTHAKAQEADAKAHYAIFDAARAFTLMDDCSPVVGTSWIDFVEPTLERAEPARGWVPARFEGSLGWPKKINDEALTWADRYLQMGDRSGVDVALDRLNLARRRQSPGDQAIDSCICLEALLGDNETQELTYRLRLRAAPPTWSQFA
jgi:hypothetical protein